ncbi:hypothetical protein KIL84_006704 [Mauremys mutica]|uniref:Uncharacterized protein n=1 Tax=Mauremys mutica TaxID=74926 RepID=A0A9D3X1E9_9SAUR|nr:hypothetical protein KIL84_006704 [Mauremys mutica]
MPRSAPTPHRASPTRAEEWCLPKASAGCAGTGPCPVGHALHRPRPEIHTGVWRRRHRLSKTTRCWGRTAQGRMEAASFPNCRSDEVPQPPETGASPGTAAAAGLPAATRGRQSHTAGQICQSFQAGGVRCACSRALSLRPPTPPHTHPSHNPQRALCQTSHAQLRTNVCPKLGWKRIVVILHLSVCASECLYTSAFHVTVCVHVCVCEVTIPTCRHCCSGSGLAWVLGLGPVSVPDLVVPVLSPVGRAGPVARAPSLPLCILAAARGLGNTLRCVAAGRGGPALQPAKRCHGVECPLALPQGHWHIPGGEEAGRKSRRFLPPGPIDTGMRLLPPAPRGPCVLQTQCQDGAHSCPVATC